MNEQTSAKPGQPTAFYLDPSAPIRAEDINALVGVVVKQTTFIPRMGLSGEQRMKLSSLLFGDAFAFVNAVGAAIGREPELFSGMGVDEKKLLATQRRAIAWKRLSSLFHELGDWAGNQGLWDQADAIRTSMKVVRQVRGEAALPIPAAGVQERKMHLIPAERILKGRQAHKVRVARKHAAPVPRVPPAPVAAEPPETPASVVVHVAHGGGPASPVISVSAPAAATAAAPAAGGGTQAARPAGRAGGGQKKKRPIPCPFMEAEIARLIDNVGRASHIHSRKPNNPPSSNPPSSNPPAPARPGPGPDQPGPDGPPAAASRPPVVPGTG